MKLALATGYTVPVSGHRRDISKLVKKKKIRFNEYTRFERYSLISFVVIQYILTLSILLPLMQLSIYSAASVQNNGFTKILVSGVFDSNNGVNDSATSFFLKICQLVFSVALPLMSTFAIAMTTISLISTVIYLTKPDTFDLIHDLNVERKTRGNSGGKNPFSGIVSFYQEKGFREFVLSMCPDFKSYAYADAISQGVDGAATMQDFLKTIPKYIMIFGFCIVINNRALLDFIMEGGQVGASLFERLTYDHDYVEIVNNFLDEGRDYTPPNWDTKKREGANKLTLYRAIYNKAKTRIAATDEYKDQRSTAFKTKMGQEVARLVDSGTFSGLDFSKEVFTVKCEYYGDNPNLSGVEGAYQITVSSLVPNDTGFIGVFTHTEDLVKNNVTSSGSGYNTTYSSCWSGGSVSDNKFSVTFDMAGLASATDIPSDFKTDNLKVNGTAKATIKWSKDGKSGTVTRQYTEGGQGNTISVNGSKLTIIASSGSDSNSIPAGAVVTEVSLDLGVSYGGKTAYTPSGLVWACTQDNVKNCTMPG